MKDKPIDIVLMSICIIGFILVLIDGMHAGPAEVETIDFLESEEFREEVSNEIHNILGGDIILTVYAEGIEAFCYRGKAKLVNDGSDGREVILIIHADTKEYADDWF